MIRYYPVKFGGHRHSDSRDKVVLVCHVILQDHVIKGSCDVMRRSPSKSVTILPSLAAIVNVVMER